MNVRPHAAIVCAPSKGGYSRFGLVRIGEGRRRLSFQRSTLAVFTTGTGALTTHAAHLCTTVGRFNISRLYNQRKSNMSDGLSYCDFAQNTELLKGTFSELGCIIKKAKYLIVC